jgi:apolipoprotein D and lipocalin family protein
MAMKPLLYILLLLATTASKAQSPATLVDLTKYSGKWYVIASIPTRFDKHWNYVTETYSLKENGNLGIYTTYIKVGETSVKDVRSKGFPSEKSHNTQWKVQFVWPFRADYLIEELGPDYSFVVVGHPKKSYLYIMNRTGKMDEALYKELVKRYMQKGYKVNDLHMVIQ